MVFPETRGPVPSRARRARLDLGVALLACALAAAAATARAQEAPPAVTPGAAAAATATVDAFPDKFDFEGSVRAARAGLARDSTSYGLWWRLARALTDRGARAGFDDQKEKAAAAYDEAVRAARRAVRLDPDRAEGHLELAVALGRLALHRGGKEKIRLSKEVKVEADRAIAIDPAADRAYHVLARWNRGIAQLSFFEKAAAKVVYGGVPEGASMNNAVTLFEKAVELSPDYANHRLELGRTFLDLGLKDKAIEHLERALTCPRRSPFDAEYKTEAQALLGKARS